MEVIRLPDAHGHLVVHREHQVDSVAHGRILQDTVHSGPGVVLQEIAETFGHDMDARIVRDGVHETLISLLVGGGALQAAYYGHFALSVEQVRRIDAQPFGKPAVIGAHVGRILVIGCLPVEKNHRYSAPVHLRDHRGQGFGLIGRDYHEVHAFAHEFPDVAYLLLGIVPRRLHAHLYVAHHGGLPLHLAVHRLPPQVLAALRYAYHHHIIATIGAG